MLSEDCYLFTSFSGGACPQTPLGTTVGLRPTYLPIIARFPPVKIFSYIPVVKVFIFTHVGSTSTALPSRDEKGSIPGGELRCTQGDGLREVLDSSLGRCNARGMGRQELHSWGSLTKDKYSPSRMHRGSHFQRKMSWWGYYSRVLCRERCSWPPSNEEDVIKGV